jgi:LEA14-like dessication related protein
MRIAKSPILPLFLAIVVAVALSGCRQLVKEAFKTPKVDIVDVNLDIDSTNRALTTWHLVATLAVDNPNPYPIEIARFTYTGMIGDEVVAEGDRPEAIRLEASKVTTVRVPVDLKPGAIETAARKVLAKRSLAWEFNGSVGVKTPLVGVVRIPFSKSGSYDLFYILRSKGIDVN